MPDPTSNAALPDASDAPTDASTDTPLDVLIVGAGLSGIGAAHHLQDRCPGKRYAILEARDAIGGTWDLFRYPGVRSDSDMYTLGYRFRPWTDPQAIADGPSILRYVRATADEGGITPKIRFGRRVVAASWSSAEACWTLRVERTGSDDVETWRARFLYLCSGYYRYAAGYRPDFPGEADFRGRLVHPQAWPEGLDHAGKRVVVIGSGATAVTVVPAMAASAAHVTMLQRSPTYVVTRPSRDAIAQALRRVLPERLAYALTRWKNVAIGGFFFRLARRRPAQVKRRIVDMAAKQLDPGFDTTTHFAPRYDPWDQRICLVPDGDLFREIRAGRVSVVTDTIERFTASGIRLASGDELPADIVVVATGLQLELLGGMALEVDGRPVRAPEAMVYKGMMLADVPNLAMSFGYTNASWTLKADLTAGWVCRLLRELDRRGAAVAVPRRDPSVEPRPFLSFTSGYVQRASALLPKQGSRKPWQVHQSYLMDLLTIRFGRLDDGVLHFGAAGSKA
jgi:cyclohexanone monooxygenase